MSDKEHSFPLIEPSLPRRLGQKMSAWLKEQKVLFEAVCVALSLHVLAVPLLWFIGWALPWPKSPVIVTVIEINLENWPNEAVPEKITDIHKSDMHKYDD